MRAKVSSSMGLGRKPSHPAARALSRSPCIAWAVTRHDRDAGGGGVGLQLPGGFPAGSRFQEHAHEDPNVRRVFDHEDPCHQGSLPCSLRAAFLPQNQLTYHAFGSSGFKVSKGNAGVLERRLSFERARRDFLQRFFHDLATPLSAVALHLEGADRRARRGDDVSESLAVARAELARAFELFDRGRQVLLAEKQRSDSFLFDEFVAEAAHLDGARAVRIEGVTGGRVTGDRRALSDALLALLVNAVESSDASSVSVVRERVGKRLRARIENPGRLPAEDTELLFSPRVAAPGKNWGMGLARARLNAAGGAGTVTLSQEKGRVIASLELPEETG